MGAYRGNEDLHDVSKGRSQLRSNQNDRASRPVVSISQEKREPQLNSQRPKIGEQQQDRLLFAQTNPIKMMSTTEAADARSQTNDLLESSHKHNTGSVAQKSSTKGKLST